MSDPLAIHDVTVSDQPTFGPSGSVGTSTVVQYWCGTHGPFRLAYPKQEATADRINHDMEQQMVLLRSVTGTGSTGG